MKSAKYHVIFWIFYFVFCYVSDAILYTHALLFAELSLFLSHNLLLFYGWFYILIKFSTKSYKTILVGIARGLLIVFVFFALRYYVRLKLLPYIGGNIYGLMGFRQWLTTGIIWVVNYFFFALAYYYFVSRGRKQLHLNSLIQQNLKREKEKFELENTLLKAQINPHFLYNILNFLYAKSLPLSQELSEGILKLSDIMRYSLQSHDNDGLVLLSEEIGQMQNLIDLAKLRFSNRINIALSVTGDTASVKIIPLVLITLLENVLKHGLLTDPDNSARIELEMDASFTLRFSTWNKKREGSKEQSTNIGLHNIIKRLKNVYGPKCDIGVRNEVESYQVNLLIRAV